jgi:hypothetical protein
LDRPAQVTKLLSWWPLAAWVWFAVTAPACDPKEPVSSGDAPAPSARTPRPIPRGSHDGAQTSLLDEHARRKPPTRAEIDAWQLPYQAKLLVSHLVRVAALDAIDELPSLLATGARWGLPDRREIHARPILASDHGEAFLTALRKAASRLAGRADHAARTSQGPRPATFSCPPMVPAAELLVRNGAEPMWCFFASHDRLDLLVFRLVVSEGRARIDYVGLFEERPSGEVIIDRDDPPPPMVPPTKRASDTDAHTARRLP